MPAESPTEEELNQYRELVKALIVRLAAVQTCLSVIQASVTTQDAFAHTESAIAIRRMVEKTHRLAFAGCPSEDVLPVLADAICEGEALAEALKDDADLLLSESNTYKQIRGIIRRWAASKVTGNDSAAH